jgi:alanyl-tRNA synthetase
VEQIVNATILDNRALNTSIQSIEEAKKDGAMALFGEKYSEEVRVVSVDGFSKELCGGTHVSATGEIGLFKIVSEGSSAAGIRRIEALTGRAALAWVEEMQASSHKLAAKLHCSPPMIEAKIDALFLQTSQLENQLKALQAKAGEAYVTELIASAVPLQDINLICRETNTPGMDELKQISDSLKAKSRNCITLLFNTWEAKLNIICVVSADLIPRYHAGKIVAILAEKLDGKGGGRPDSAMAGGKALHKIPEVMKGIPELLKTL